MDLRNGIFATAQAIGADPYDLATVISYETGGTFDPMQRGPKTQWGQHRGLIQFGEPQARQHGVNWDDPIGSQLGPDGAVASYLKSSGFKPGMGLLDLYSTINAGAPGRYGASDANNGGAPGDVRDKVTNQMAGHRQKAMALLGGDATVSTRGQTPMRQPTQRPQPQQQPQGQPQEQKPDGILARMFPNAKEGAMDQIALSLMSMSSYPTPGMEMMMGGIQDRMKDRRETKKTQTQTNKTIEALRQAGVPDEDLQIAMSNPGYMRALMGQLAQRRMGQPEAGYRQVLGSDIGMTGENAERMFNVGPDGKITGIGGGGVEVNNNAPAAETAFQKKTGDLLAQEAADVVTQGAQAQRNMGNISRLGALLENVPEGAQGAFTAAASNLGLKLDGASDVEAAQAIISQLVPQQRPPGSGVMSDADLELFKRSLPRLINTREGNKKIVDTMRSIAEYDMQRGRIARMLQLGEIDPQQAAQMYSQLGNPLEGFMESGAIQSDRPGVDTIDLNGTTYRIERVD